MFKMRTLLVLGAAFVLVGCNQPQQKAADEGMDYDQKTNPDVTPFEMYLVGSVTDWDPAKVAGELKEQTQFHKIEGSAKLEYTLTVPDASWVGFKFIAAGSWSEQYGVEDIDIEHCNDAFKEVIGFGEGKTYADLDAFRLHYKAPTSNRSNVGGDDFHLAAGSTVKITYDPLDFRSDSANDTTYTYKFVLDYTAPAVA